MAYYDILRSLIAMGNEFDNWVLSKITPTLPSTTVEYYGCYSVIGLENEFNKEPIRWSYV